MFASACRTWPAEKSACGFAYRTASATIARTALLCKAPWGVTAQCVYAKFQLSISQLFNDSQHDRRMHNFVRGRRRREASPLVGSMPPPGPPTLAVRRRHTLVIPGINLRDHTYTAGGLRSHRARAPPPPARANTSPPPIMGLLCSLTRHSRPCLGRDRPTPPDCDKPPCHPDPARPAAPIPHVHILWPMTMPGCIFPLGRDTTR